MRIYTRFNGNDQHSSATDTLFAMALATMVMRQTLSHYTHIEYRTR